MSNISLGQGEERVETVVKKSETSDEPVEYMVIRRRRGRRRRQALEAEAPIQRFRLILLIVIVGLIIVAVSGIRLHVMVGDILQQIKAMLPVATMKKLARPEILLLLVAACILLYLMVPGLDEKVMRFFGIRRHRRR